MITRRGFMSAALAAGAAAAQTEESPRRKAPDNTPTRKAKVVKLFKSPDGHPNALEATHEGLWIGDQVTERAWLVDWKTGKVLRAIETESHNTSGIAVGGGYLWLSANGGVSGRRPARPTDKPIGEVVQADLKTGKTVKVHPLAWRGGVHGMVYVEQTRTLWITALSINALAEVDPRDNFRILHLIPVRYSRAHGLEWDDGAIWCVFSNEREIQKLDAKTGKVLEVVTLTKDDPTPHGMCRRDGHFYYCDAGYEPQQSESVSPSAGYVCRIDL
jgi:streptogramin lyase